MFIDVNYESLNKYGESLCGDCVFEIRSGDSVTIVLSDGLGSGVKANILSTLTSKIIATMISKGATIEDAVLTIAKTLPVCAKREIAYSTFSIIQVSKNGEVYLVQFDNPDMVFVRAKTIIEYEKIKRVIGDKQIFESRFIAKEGDMFVLFSDGVVHAGVGNLLNLGWQYHHVKQFIEKVYENNMPAITMVKQVINTCNHLYGGKAGDDTTCLSVSLKKDIVCHIASGPPKSIKDDKKYAKEWNKVEGMRIVCGGTTSQVIARELNKEIITKLDYVDPSLPPTAKIDGVDLVTEGVLTLHRVNDLANRYIEESINENELNKKDGATKLFRLIFLEATSVIFHVGTAINEAHQNPNLPTDFSYKQTIIKSIIDKLNILHKEVKCKYY